MSDDVIFIGCTTTNSSTLLGQVMWNGHRVIDDDNGGTAGVREPRRSPPSGPSPAAVALELAVPA